MCNNRESTDIKLEAWEERDGKKFKKELNKEQSSDLMPHHNYEFTSNT